MSRYYARKLNNELNPKGVIVTWDSHLNEFQVNTSKGNYASVYYTDTYEDALRQGMMMAEKTKELT